MGVGFVRFAYRQAPWGREHLLGTSLCIASQTKSLISGPMCYQNEAVGLWCIKLAGWNMQLNRAQHLKGGNSTPASVSIQMALETMQMIL